MLSTSLRFPDTFSPSPIVLRRGLASSIHRQFRRSSNRFTRLTGLTVSDVLSRWRLIGSARAARSALLRRSLEDPPSPPPQRPSWVRSAPPGDIVWTACDGACPFNSDTWAKGRNSSWSCSTYLGSHRRSLRSGFTPVHADELGWTGALSGSSHGSEGHGSVELLKSLFLGDAVPLTRPSRLHPQVVVCGV